MISKNKIKFIKSLGTKKGRDLEKLFVVEGEKSVRELILFYEAIIHSVYATKDFDAQEFQNIEEVAVDELKQISSLKTPNKVLAICHQFDHKLENEGFIIALDEIQDPGNLGTIIRLADWFKVDAIICSSNSVDVYNPKVIQAGMGSIFRTKIIYLDLENYLKETHLPIYGAFLEGENVYQKSLEKKGILLLGNEGNGISKNLENLVQHKISIPKSGEAESLNVAIAGAVLLSEFCRGEFQ